MATKPVPTEAIKPKILMSGPEYPVIHPAFIRERAQPWHRMSRDVKMDAARHIVALLIKAAEGPLDCPETWKAVARRRNIRCYTSYDKSDGRGGFEAPGRDAPDFIGGSIFVSALYDKIDQARGWVHELAHSILYHWQVGMLANGADMWLFSDIEEEAHHEIAELVESIFFD